jgi:peptidoglycan-associated lipoprotein
MLAAGRLAFRLHCWGAHEANDLRGGVMRSILVLSTGLLFGVACSHAQPAPAPAQVVAEPAPPAPPPAPEPVVARPAPEVAPASVYFDYDASELSEGTRVTLQSFFDQARQRPDEDVRIEGNCDERGTREYNLALGQRRADAARKYLENLGLASARITAVSNGKERPRATGHDEAAWKQNRRDDLTPSPGKVAVSSGADQTTR